MSDDVLVVVEGDLDVGVDETIVAGVRPRPDRSRQTLRLVDVLDEETVEEVAEVVR